MPVPAGNDDRLLNALFLALPLDSQHRAPAALAGLRAGYGDVVHERQLQGKPLHQQESPNCGVPSAARIVLTRLV
jgi:hypothetical protein